MRGKRGGRGIIPCLVFGVSAASCCFMISAKNCEEIINKTRKKE